MFMRLKSGHENSILSSYLYALRSIWIGLPTIYQEAAKLSVDPQYSDTNPLVHLLPTNVEVKAGFALTDPKDSRYQAVVAHRTRYGNVIHKAALALRGSEGGEDHIDAVIGVTKAIDVYLLEYAITRANFIALQKNYQLAREYVFLCSFCSSLFTNNCLSA